nr:Endo-beta-N-acetylglucosaminidase [Kibdelosporangium sp. MJ126-NF4]
MSSSRRVFLRIGALSTASVMATPLTRAAAASDVTAATQPYASYWHPATILNWTPDAPDARYNRSTVPLAPRAPSAWRANAHARPNEARVQALVAFAPTSNNPAQGALDMNYYAVNYWQYMDELVFWGGSASEGLILAPNPTVTDAAHRNGVRVLGNVFLPPTAYGGQIQWVRDFVRRSGSRFVVADKMIEVARHHGFDGWFVNQETAGGDTALATAMKEFLIYLRAGGLRVIWYDAMTRTGSVSWQNALTSANQQFFQDGSTRVSDEVFLNFWWSTSGLSSSAGLARSLSRSPYDLFAGVDVEANGYDTSVGWPSVFPENQSHITSLGFYRPEWTFTSASGPADFYARDSRFWVGQNGDPSNTATSAAWKGVAHYVSEQTPITSLPFVTNFNTGHGRKFAVDGTVLSTSAWNNLSLQDVLPTWRWVVESSGTKLTPSLDWDTPYDGGTSLRISGSTSATNTIRLFATRLRLAAGDSLTLVHQTQAGPSRLQVGVSFSDAPGQLTFLDVGTSAGGWQQRTFDLAPYAGRDLVGIAIRVLAGSSTLYIGRLGVHGATQAPPAPTSLFVAQNGLTSARLTWTKAPGAIRHYRVYQVGASARTFLGATGNDAYFIPSIIRNSGQSVTLEVQSVNEAFVPSATTARITLPPA